MKIPPLGCEPPFDAAYHGRDERAWRERYASIFRSCFPRAGLPSASPGDRLRIAVVVTRDHRRDLPPLHAGTRRELRSGAVRRVGRLCPVGTGADPGRDQESPGRVLPVPDKFEKWVETLGGGRFDLLYFFEVGSDAFNYFLPFLRLAPVQCVGMGTGHTTGIPEMDYYVSSDLMKPPTPRGITPSGWCG